MDLELSAQPEHGMPAQTTQKGVQLAFNDRNWESLRKDIHTIYMTENNTLPQTMTIIEEKHNFKAS
jgi:hypothetical protein